MGCGRTGATLASEFESRGHSVSVIDVKADAFRRLPSDFKGQKITGLGFDRDTLTAAGVEDAYAFAAVSDGDNSNILAARVVKETYGVENVVARIADSGRADVYRRLGIPTVAPVPWTAAQIVTRLLPGGSEAEFDDADAGIVMRRIPFNDGWVAWAVCGSALESSRRHVPLSTGSCLRATLARKTDANLSRLAALTQRSLYWQTYRSGDRLQCCTATRLLS